MKFRNIKIRLGCLFFIILMSGLCIFYFVITSELFNVKSFYFIDSSIQYSNTSISKDDYNIWLIFTKVYEGSPLTHKFSNLVANLLKISAVPLKFNIIVDNSSRKIAETIIFKHMRTWNKSTTYDFYNMSSSAKLVEDIVIVMKGFFSKPGSYYSDVLFYMSLGLHRIAPKSQNRAILLDCDILFKKDVIHLFNEFKRFKSTALFGLAPELSPVYRHVLRSYRNKYNTTTFGSNYNWNMTSNDIVPHSRGFQGYNSGVVLLKLDLIRTSTEYNLLLKKPALVNLTEKYNFKRGHLGDQDFYTLVGCEYPHLIQTLNCGFNKQLCTWWRDHGYGDVFDHYNHCEHDTVILHGNCNTEIPKF